MMERKERKPYWRHTKWQMLASVVPFLVLIIVLPLYAESLNTERFLGFPLGYFLSAQLRVSLPGLPRDTAYELIKRAHHTCPYSKMTRGNINVGLELL